mgnify:CR=1 FL=1
MNLQIVRFPTVVFSSRTASPNIMGIVGKSPDFDTFCSPINIPSDNQLFRNSWEVHVFTYVRIGLCGRMRSLTRTYV